MGKLLSGHESLDGLTGKYFFLDADFLSSIFNDGDLLSESFHYFDKTQGYWLLDPLTKFEFLRDVFLPEQLDLKDGFLRKEIFITAEDHQSIFSEIKDNALLLSKIYSHQRQKIKSNSKLKPPSAIDLFLAARIMLYEKTSFLVTGNRQDFPSPIFDILCALNYEQNDGSVRVFCVLKFNKEVFNKCYDEYKKISTR